MKLKKLVRNYTPSQDDASNSSALRFARNFLLGQNIWHLNRRSIAGGVFVGIFCAMMPIPGQMLLAVVMALVLRAHLPLSLACTWISNPLTYAPIYYFNYRIGLLIYNTHEEVNHHTFEITAFYENLYTFLLPLLTGSIVCGIVFGLIGYVTVRLYWRFHVLQSWDKRRLRKKNLETAQQTQTPTALESQEELQQELQQEQEQEQEQEQPTETQQAEIKRADTEGQETEQEQEQQTTHLSHEEPKSTDTADETTKPSQPSVDYSNVIELNPNRGTIIVADDSSEKNH